MAIIKCAVCGRSFLSRGVRVCPSCMRSYRALIRKKKCIEYLGGKCAKCGRTDEAVLTFHHIDSTQKNFNISDWIGMSPGFETMTWDELKSEIDKTTCLCFNCHRLEHYRHPELKEYIPYLTKEQRQELEADIIHDSELLTILNDEEAIRDSLMTVEEPTDIALELQRHQDKLEALLKEPASTTEIRTCLFCGESYTEDRESFCSDYCQQEAAQLALELDIKRPKYIEELATLGMTGTLQKHGWKRKQLTKRLPFLMW